MENQRAANGASPEGKVVLPESHPLSVVPNLLDEYVVPTLIGRIPPFEEMSQLDKDEKEREFRITIKNWDVTITADLYLKPLVTGTKVHDITIWMNNFPGENEPHRTIYLRVFLPIEGEDSLFEKQKTPQGKSFCVSEYRDIRKFKSDGVEAEIIYRALSLPSSGYERQTKLQIFAPYNGDEKGIMFYDWKNPAHEYFVADPNTILYSQESPEGKVLKMLGLAKEGDFYSPETPEFFSNQNTEAKTRALRLHDLPLSEEELQEVENHRGKFLELLRERDQILDASLMEWPQMPHASLS